MGENGKMVKDIPVLENGKYSEYDVDEASETLAGCRKKKYYRVSTELLSELIDELKNNPESSYVTHCNDLVKDHGYIPDYMSAIIKRSGLSFALNEVASSRIMNYFGAPTTYEKIFRLPPNPKSKVSDNENYAIASIDFQSCEYEEMSLADLNIFLEMDLERDIPVINNALEKLFFKKKYFLHTNKVISRRDFDIQKTKIIEDYVYSFLIRKFIIRDGDLHAGNCSIIIDPKSLDIKSFVNFDYEDAIREKYEAGKYSYEQMKYALLMYPDVFKKFKNKVDELVSINDDVQKLNLVYLLNKELPRETKEKNDLIIQKLYDNSVEASRVSNNVIRDVFMSRANYERIVR